MDQNLKKNFDWNSATNGVGLAEASKLLKMASANPTPLAAESFEALQVGFLSKNFFAGELYLIQHINNLNVITWDL